MEYVIAIVGSFVAGCINTLAGNGSSITLTILTEIMGLSGNIANATNRIGVLAQSIVGNWTFYKKGKLDLQKSWKYVIPVSLGSVVGSLMAVWISNEQFRWVFKVMMLVMLLIILVKPERWLRSISDERAINPLLLFPAFFAIGFYGGFLQMGVGLFILAILVLGARFNMMEANALKIYLAGVITFIAVLIFQWGGIIDWKIGLLMAIGQSLGTYVTANFATQYANANLVAYRLLVLMVVFAILRLFGVSDWIMNLFK